jgi:hypothetical protein
MAHRSEQPFGLIGAVWFLVKIAIMAEIGAEGKMNIDG